MRLGQLASGSGAAALFKLLEELFVLEDDRTNVQLWDWYIYRHSCSSIGMAYEGLLGSLKSLDEAPASTKRPEIS